MEELLDDTKNGFEEITKRLVEKCEAGELGGVAFESDDSAILSHSYNGNIFVTPHSAHCTEEALVRMFEVWADSTLGTVNGKAINQVDWIL